MDFSTLTDNEVNALAPHTFSYSVPILQYFSEKENYVGSGTLVQVGPRFFVATAAHNLTKDGIGVADHHLYLGYAKKAIHEAVPFSARKPSAGEREPSIDVGYIELARETAESMTENEFLPLDRVRPFINSWPSRVFLTGFPAEIVPLEPASRNKFYLNAIGYLTETKRPDDPACKGDSSTDIFIDYQKDSIIVQTQQNINMPRPHGFSGGGLWALPLAEKGVLWAPSEATLIGIQRSRVRGTPAILCCTQTQHWLESIVESYSDLTDIIQVHLQSMAANEQSIDY